MTRPLERADRPAASAAYHLVASTAFAVMRAQGWRFHTTGLEHVPAHGGVVVATNHISFVDFFVAGRPIYRLLGRPVRILAKKSLFRTPGFGPLMRTAGHIPVHREGGRRGALASAVAALRAGELVLVMPEQTISTSFDLLAFRTGAARMAALAGVPLVPAVTWGAHRFSTVGRACRPQWRLPVVASYGAPLTVDDVEDVAAATEVLRARVGDLLDAAVSGYPDGIPSGAWWVPARFGGGAPAMGARPDALRRGVGHRTWAG